MTAQAIAAAGEAQPELPLLKLLGDWEAVSAMFLAPPLDLGFGGGGSARRMAVTQLIDMPKVKGEKRSGVKRAREKVRAMGDDEVKELASKRASAIGEASFHTRPPPLPQFALAPTRRPHLHAYRPLPSHSYPGNVLVQPSLILQQQALLVAGTHVDTAEEAAATGKRMAAPAVKGAPAPRTSASPPHRRPYANHASLCTWRRQGRRP